LNPVTKRRCIKRKLDQLMDKAKIGIDEKKKEQDKII